MRSRTLLCALLACTAVLAQDDVLIFGRIQDHFTREPIPDARVVVSTELGVRDTVSVDTNGTYGIHVSYDRLWQLRYEAPGRVSKRIMVDARRIPPAEREGGHGMNIDLRLFLAQPGKDYSAMEGPISIARYVDSTGNIEWDLAMAERMRTVINELAGEGPTKPVARAAPAAPQTGMDPLKLLLAGALALLILAFALRALRARNQCVPRGRVSFR